MDPHQPKVGSLEGWLSSAATACSRQAAAPPRSTSPFANQSPHDAFTPPRCVLLSTSHLGQQPPLISTLPHPADLVCTIRNPCGQCVSTSNGSSIRCASLLSCDAAAAAPAASSCAIDVNHEGTMRRGRPRLYHATASSSLPLPATGAGLSLESLCSALSSPASHIAMAVRGGGDQQQQLLQPLQPQPLQPQPSHSFPLHHSFGSEDCHHSGSSSTARLAAAAAAAPSSPSAVHAAAHVTTTATLSAATDYTSATRAAAGGDESDRRLRSLRRQMEQLLMVPLPDHDDNNVDNDGDCGVAQQADHSRAAAPSACNTSTSALQRACALADQRHAAAGAVSCAAATAAAAAAAPVRSSSSSAPLLTSRRGLFEGTVRGGEPRNSPWVWAPPAVAISAAAAC